MRIGLSTWSLLGMDVYSAVKAIGDSGLDYIEIWGEVPHGFPGWVDEARLRDALSPYSMKLTAHAPFTDLNPASPFQPVKGAVEEALERFIEFSAGIGAAIVTVHPGSVHSEALLPQSEESSASTIGKMVRAAGGRLAVNIENQQRSTSRYHFPLASTPESLYSMLKKVPGTGCTLDSGHAHASGQSPIGMAERLGGTLTEVHLTDNSGASDDHLIPGRGTAPLYPLLRQLARKDILVCLEINPHRYPPAEVMGAIPSIIREYGRTA